MKAERAHFFNFLKEKGLKLTQQRETILNAFLKTEKHVSVEDLYNIARRKDSTIGQATVFRTLKLLAEAEIASHVDIGDGIRRFEHRYNHKHHDHLICLKCHKVIEAVDESIEQRQEALCKKFSFQPVSHRLEIFGVCKKCSGKVKN
jgi:Fur family ferric uptake transcriptional regulator